MHIWRASLAATADVLAVCQALLSPDELARAMRYRFTRDRYRYICGRGQLRQLLSRYLAQPAGEIEIELAPHGKPQLTAPNALGLQFNLAHSADWLIYAFARHRAVGVDIEAMRDDVDFAELVPTVFSAAEQAEWRQLPHALQKPAFYRAWACKEAFIKAIGLGLMFPLQDFDVQLHPSQPAALLALRSTHFQLPDWQLFDLPTPAGFVGAVCVGGVSKGQSVKVLRCQSVNSLP
ncbi:MAG: 4'-phosphopantetheinyl transferase superfamily protein [Anaerolineae bacterium]|nr:4'-phosphopantetheinyl transferase superfamily protein [Anaerolineae bacterium]